MKRCAPTTPIPVRCSTRRPGWPGRPIGFRRSSPRDASTWRRMEPSPRSPFAKGLWLCGLLVAAAACATARPRLYVSNEASNDISEIDLVTETVRRTIPVGKRPRGIRLSPDQRLLYVAVSGSPRAPPGVDEKTLPPPDRAADGIAVVDLERGAVVRNLATGDDPESFDIDLHGERIFVSNEDAATASLVDIASGKVTRAVPVGAEPEGVRTRPDGKVVYVTSEADNAVFALDAQSGDVLAKME